MNVREQLKAYYDNELSPAQAEEVRLLLEREPALVADLDEIAALSQTLRTESVQPEPYGLERTLGALTARKKQTFFGPYTWWQYAIGAMSVMIMAVIVFPVFAQSKSAAKSTAMLSQAKMKAIAGEMADSAPTAAAAPMAQAQQRNLQMQSSARMRAGKSSEGVSDGGLQFEKAKSPISSFPSALVVKNGSIQLKVDSADTTQANVESITRSAGGFVESASKQDINGNGFVSMTLRVPAARFESVVTQIRALGKVITQSFSGEDVTAQVADVDARLRTLRAEEQQYIALMGRATKIGEVLQVKEKITEVREQIESLDAQQKSLRSQASMSTLNVEITQKPKPVAETPKPIEHTWYQNAWLRASEHLTELGRGLGTVAIYLLVYSPIWLAFALVGWLAYKRRRL